MKTFLQLSLLSFISAVSLVACSGDELYVNSADVYYVHPHRHYYQPRPVVVTTSPREYGYRHPQRGFVPVPGPAVTTDVRPMRPPRVTTEVRPMRRPQVTTRVQPIAPEANVAVTPGTRRSFRRDNRF